MTVLTGFRSLAGASLLAGSRLRLKIGIKIDGEGLGLKHSINGCSCDTHHTICGHNLVPGSIIGFQKVVITDELSKERRGDCNCSYFVERQERKRHKGGSWLGFCPVGFLSRNSIKKAPVYIGRHAEVQELLENS